MKLGATFKFKGDKNAYSFSDRECIGRECWAAGMFQHRSPMSGGGSRNTGSPDTPCCLNRAYRGCPDGPVGREEQVCDICDGAKVLDGKECQGCGGCGKVILGGLPIVSPELAKQRKADGWRLA